MKDDVLIRDELGIDSVRAMEIFYACEKAFTVKLDEENPVTCRRLGTLYLS